MRIHYLSLSILFLLVSVSSISHAGLKSNVREYNLAKKNLDFTEPEFVIKNMKVKEISSEEFDKRKDNGFDNIIDLRIPYATNNRNSANNVIEVIDKIIAIGEKVIPLIEKGRAVYQSKNMGAISVIPNLGRNESSLASVSNWSYPVTKHFSVVFENLYGVDVVSFVYSVTFQYGGTYAGKGKYLTGVRVATRDVKVMWGFDVDAHSELIQISNVGTSSNVIAGATIEINYTVGNFLNVISTAESFHVTGDGRIFKLD